MARRDEYDDFDDEDYEPRPRRRAAAAGRRYPLILFGGLAIGAIVVAGLFIFAIRSARNAVERATEQVAHERQAALAQLKQAQGERTRPRPPEPNWPKMVGTWSREPAGKEDRDYPYRFEFRENKTCTTTRVNFDGHPTQQESSVQVIADQNDLVRLALIVPAGRYVYSFLLKPDGTLVLDEKGGLVFTRAK